MQNAIEARSTVITLLLEQDGEGVRVRLEDNGSGMDEVTLRRILDPFFTDGVKHPGRRVGLGLPFLKQMLEGVDGTFNLESRPGVGTELEFSYSAGHLDAPPITDMTGTLATLLAYTGTFELKIHRRKDGAEYEVQRSELIEALGELDSAGSQTLLEEYLSSQEESLSIP